MFSLISFAWFPRDVVGAKPQIPWQGVIKKKKKLKRKFYPTGVCSIMGFHSSENGPSNALWTKFAIKLDI
jgi:hypothetical protein